MASTRASGSRATSLVIAVVTGVLLYVINRSPGWAELGIVTADAAPVIPWINAALGVAFVSSVILVFVDSPGLRVLAGIVVGGLAVWIAFRLLVLYPFPYGDLSGQGTLVRVVLAAVMISGLIAVLLSVGRLLRGGGPS